MKSVAAVAVELAALINMIHIECCEWNEDTIVFKKKT